jgi:hypothetical protein
MVEIQLNIKPGNYQNQDLWMKRTEINEINFFLA